MNSDEDDIRFPLEYNEQYPQNIKSIANCKICRNTTFIPCNSSCNVNNKTNCKKRNIVKIKKTHIHSNGNYVLIKVSLKDTISHDHMDLVEMSVHKNFKIERRKVPNLYFGVMSNCEHAVNKILVNAGNDINVIINIYRRDVWKPLIHLAIINQQPKIVQILLHYGANPSIPDGNGLYAIHKAACLGNVDLVNLLLAHGAKVDQVSSSGHTALQFAIYHKRRDVVNLLLEKEADPYYKSPNGLGSLHLVMDRYDEEIAKKFNRYKFDLEDRLTTTGDTPLLFVSNGNRSRFLSDVCCSCPFRICVKLHEFKCRIISPNSFAGALDLLKRGANPNACNNRGYTPLYYAVDKCCSYLVQKLLHYGAEANQKPVEGSKSLLEIAISRCLSKVKLLLTYGADPGILLGYQFSLSPQIKEIIDLHLMTIKTLGIKVNQILISKIKQDDEMKIFEVECYKQVDKLKKIVLNDNNFTAFDLLIVNRRRLAFAATRHNSRSIFNMLPTAIKSAPIYENMIKIKCNIARSYAPILKKGIMSLNVICHNRLDAIPLEKIISFLNYSDIKNLIITVQMR